MVFPERKRYCGQEQAADKLPTEGTARRAWAGARYTLASISTISTSDIFLTSIFLPQPFSFFPRDHHERLGQLCTVLGASY